LHIAQFTNFYLPHVNGVVRSVESFRKALAGRGHNVFVFAQANNGYKDEAPFIFRYPSLTLPMQVEVPAVIPVSSFIDQLLPSLKLDVIHTHHPILLGQTAARKAEELDLPLVFTFHTQYQEYTHYVPLPQETIQEFLKSTVVNWLREFMRKCHHIVIPSESMKEILVRDYGLRDRYTVIPTGLDLKPYNKRTDGKKLRASMGWQDDKVLVSIGRLAQEKNFHTLLQAAQKVYGKNPDLRLVIIGDGPEKTKLQELASELGIAERVTFTGELPFADVTSYLKAADVFGFASITETQGLVTMEAMAAGLPVVAVDASGTRDIVDNGKQGMLVENDADALANVINRLFRSPKRMENYGKNALKKAETFTVRKCTELLVDVYKQAIQDKADGQNVQVEEIEPT
jgi:glycosyltransferase involved in cell wall biosynthesis